VGAARARRETPANKAAAFAGVMMIPFDIRRWPAGVTSMTGTISIYST
jgi:hypothetical protein